ncbi:MAG: SGNH/GDSL hydrolase family protein [Anaerolineae bacterium]
MIRRFLLIYTALILTACQQEIYTDAAFPAMTSVSSTMPVLTTAVSVTATSTFSPSAALGSGPVSLITIGDDFTRGDGDELGHGYPDRLLPLVSQIRPSSTVTNFGQTGWTSDDLINGVGDFSSQLLSAVDEVNSATSQRRAAVVLVWIGGNDLWKLYTGKTPVTVEQEDLDAQRFAENIETILFELRDVKAEVIIAKLDDQSKRPARTRAETYPDITADELLRMSKQVERYNQIISDLANQYGALTVDFYGSDIFIESETLASNGFHPNPTGYALIAQAWYKVVSRILP